MSKPDQKSVEYQRMEPQWSLPDALLSGTAAMRAGQLETNGAPLAEHQAVGTAWLPAHPGESPMRYRQRSRMTFLRNFYARTLTNLVGKMLANGVQPGDDVPPALVDMLEDVDLMGNNVNVFARQCARAAIHKGGAYVLVDSQSVDVESQADQRATGLRPYLVLYELQDVLGVRTEVIGGQEVITQARLKREQIVPKDDFADEVVCEVLEYRQDITRLYQKTGGEYVLIDEQPNRLGFVPLVPININPTAPHEFRPVLEHLAEMNLEHFQIRSDQRNALSVASFPVPCVAGWDSQKDPEIVFGPFNMLATNDPQGKFYYLESSGSANEQCSKELERLEEQMRLFGLQFEVRAGSTATGNAIDAQEATSPLQTWCESLKDALENALMMMARRMGQTEGGSLSIDPPEPMSQAVVQEAELLLKTRMMGDISRAAYLMALKRRGILHEDYDPEEDAELIDAAMPPALTAQEA